MSDYRLVYPMLALVLLTFGVAVVLFRARVRSVREGRTPVSYFRTFQGSPEPEFLAGAVPLVLAWGFVAAPAYLFNRLDRGAGPVGLCVHRGGPAGVATV